MLFSVLVRVVSSLAVNHCAVMILAEGYVADELIVSRAGVRIRVGNTDAEGRMAMSDVLCQMKELVSDVVGILN